VPRFVVLRVARHLRRAQGALPARTVRIPPRQLRRVADLSVPIAISMLSFGAMTMVDTLLVGHIGAGDLAAVGVGGTVALALLAFSTGIFRLLKLHIAREVGNGNPRGAANVVGAGLLLAPLLGVLTFALGHALSPWLGVLAGEANQAKTTTYFLVRLATAPVILLNVVLREARHGQGDSRTAMRAALLANSINLAADVFFLYGLGLGVFGAALATWAAALSEVGFLARAQRTVDFDWRSAAKRARELFAVGLPSGAQNFFEMGAAALLGILIARTGALEVASHQVTGQLAQLSLIPSQAISEAGAVLAARAMGAGQRSRVRLVGRSALVLASSWALFCLLLFLVAGPALAKGMSSDRWVQAIAGKLVVLAGIVHFVNAPNQVARGMLRGVGDIRAPAFFSVGLAWSITLPLAWYLAIERWMGAMGGWIGLGFEVLVGAMLFWMRFEADCAGGCWKAALAHVVPVRRRRNCRRTGFAT